MNDHGSADFRRQAHEFVDWMADYLETVGERPVKPPVKPGEIAARLAADPPGEGEPIEAIFEDFKADILPGMTHWQHPRFFAYFPANSSPPSVLAEMLTATLGAQCMSWQTSPAATELETHVMGWLRDLLGLPGDWQGAIQETASGATLAALLSARERATGWRSNDDGLSDLPRMTVYASGEAHSSIDKAVKVAGFGLNNLRKIELDDAFSMKPEALAAAIEQDVAQGYKPACVVAALGSTGVGAFDPLGPIGEICAHHGIWLHVDAAWAGSALVLPEQRWMIEGIERADSFVFNPHKWLFTNFDCSAYFVRDPEALLRTFEILPEYLKTREGEAVLNYRDWGIALGRRFRALKLWFVIRNYGIEGLRRHIGNHIAWTQELSRRIDESPDFELLAPTRLALVCFRYHPTDAGDLDGLNETLLETLNDSGRLYVTHIRIRGAYAIRFAIGQTSTTRRDIDEAWRQIEETARALQEEAT